MLDVLKNECFKGGVKAGITNFDFMFESQPQRREATNQLLMIKKLLDFVLNKSFLGRCLQVSQSYSGPRICLLQDKTN